MTIDIISEYRDLVTLQPEWDALWLSSRSPGYEHSSTFALVCLQEIHNDRRSALRCIVIRRSGKVVLIWPLLIRRMAGVKILSPLWSMGAEYTEPIVEDGLEGPEAMELVASAWRTARSKIATDIISIPQVKVGSYIHTIVSREKPVDVETDTCYVVEWDKSWTDWDAYCKIVSTGHHSNQGRKRKYRRLAEQGDLEFQILTAPSETTPMIDWLLEHKRDWAERVNKRGSWLYSESYRNFLVAVFAAESACQTFAIFVLKLNGTPIAAKVVAYNNKKLDWIITAFDSAWQKYSPGSILDEYGVRWAFDRRLELDFGVGPVEFKQLWSNNNGITTMSYRFSGSLLGAIAMKGWEWRRRWRIFRKQIPEKNPVGVAPVDSNEPATEEVG
jgi:CelD/BcsL family acetyltransferase involved in cellulose biosynthesis